MSNGIEQEEYLLSKDRNDAVLGYHLPPLKRLLGLVRYNKSALAIVICYTSLSGVLSLSIPVTTQVLVNIIAAGILVQPLVVLTALLFCALIFNGVMRLLHLRLVEIIRQHTFAEIALRMGDRILRVEHSALANEYMPELVNRFFDVVNIQKSWAKILLEMPAAFLTIVAGLIIMGVYSPFLLAFGVFTLLSMFGILVGLGYGGVSTDIEASRHKYLVAQWLEELARCETSFKMSGLPRYLHDRTDELVVGYIHARQAHFGVIFRQALGNHLFQAVAASAIFGIGGLLVIDRQLTLGQLVASELVVVSVLAAIEKVVINLDNFYDLLTGLDKIGYLTDLSFERIAGKEIDLSPEKKPVALECRELHFSYVPGQPVLRGLDLNVQGGDKVSVVGPSGAGKSTLSALICGLREPSLGSIKVGGVDIKDIALSSYRKQIAMVSDTNEIFDGTIEENITLGRSFVSHADLVWALDVTLLNKDIAAMPHGLSTTLVSAGKNLSGGQMQRILLARAIIERPVLLILDEAFSGIDENTKLAIANELFSSKYDWTVITISHDPQLIWLTDKVYVLAGGKIIEHGAPIELADDPGSVYSHLFSGRMVRGLRLREDNG